MKGLTHHRPALSGSSLCRSSLTIGSAVTLPRTFGATGVGTEGVGAADADAAAWMRTGVVEEIAVVTVWAGEGSEIATVLGRFGGGL